MGRVNDWFFDRRRNPLLGSVGSLIIKLWKWFRGDRLESVLANQLTNEELKLYQPCPGTSERLSRTGSR
jgi:hypothetical protein